MRIRLQLLLPLAAGLLVAAAFAVAAASIGDAVRETLTTVPGITRDRAVEAAVRQVGVAGALATLAAVLLGALLAWMIASPLRRMRRSAQRLAEAADAERPGSPVAEIQDVARGLTRVTGELRDRQSREAKERAELAALMDAVSDGIIQLDAGGRIVRTNRAARELLGVPADAARRPASAMIRNPEVRRLLVRGARGAVVEPSEVVVDDRRLLVVVAPQSEGVVATLVDLTDLRRLEEVRRDFVANASHELKTPLTSIRGYTETLLAGDLDAEDQRQFLDTIARNAGRLQRIVDDLLDLSRMESGRWTPDLQPLDPLEVAERAWLSFSDRAAEQGVDFQATESPGMRALGDPRALEQVFANLFDNALRYTPAGGRVSVRVAVEEAGAVATGRDRDGWAGEPPEPTGPWVVADVADTGAGISRDALPRIFERFYRVDPARSRAEGGTGLGLSIVKHMMETQGGAVTARSELGRGTTLRLWLPAAPSE